MNGDFGIGDFDHIPPRGPPCQSFLAARNCQHIRAFSLVKESSSALNFFFRLLQGPYMVQTSSSHSIVTYGSVYSHCDGISNRKKVDVCEKGFPYHEKGGRGVGRHP